MKRFYWDCVMLRHPKQLCKQGMLGKSDGQKGNYDCPLRNKEENAFVMGCCGMCL